METYHILPVNDLKEHEEETDCHCEPTVEWHEGGLVVIHNAYDGRELYEEAERNIKENTN